MSVYAKDSIRYNGRMDGPIEDLALIRIEIFPQKCNLSFVLACYKPPGDPIRAFETLETILFFS